MFQRWTRILCTPTIAMRPFSCVPSIGHCCRWNMGCIGQNPWILNFPHSAHSPQKKANMAWFTSTKIWSRDLSRALTSSDSWVILTHLPMKWYTTVPARTMQPLHSGAARLNWPSLLDFTGETIQALRSSHGPEYPAPNKIKILLMFGLVLVVDASIQPTKKNQEPIFLRLMLVVDASIQSAKKISGNYSFWGWC